ncbi:MAG: hypothetical protein QOD75_3552 [Blastocatellia bacterium]|jgi:hypothetical protein|nr:hypothetical protein [Blastocatellia bacterium]
MLSIPQLTAQTLPWDRGRPARQSYAAINPRSTLTQLRRWLCRRGAVSVIVTKRAHQVDVYKRTGCSGFLSRITPP